MCQDLSSLYLRGNKHPFTKLISYFRVPSGCVLTVNSSGECPFKAYLRCSQMSPVCTCQRSNGGDVASGSSTSRESIWRCTSASGYTILSYICYIWGFPDMGVPQIGRFIVENPINMDDLEVPLFQESPIYPTYGVYYHSEKTVDSPNIVYIYSFLCLRIVLGISAGSSPLHPILVAHLIHPYPILIRGGSSRDQGPVFPFGNGPGFPQMRTKGVWGPASLTSPAQRSPFVTLCRTVGYCSVAPQPCFAKLQ